MRDAVIVDAVRAPVGKRNGALSRTHAASLSAHVLNALVARSGLNPSVVDDVIWGCVETLGMQSQCIARSAVLSAGWPEHVPGVTVDRAPSQTCDAARVEEELAALELLDRAWTRWPQLSRSTRHLSPAI